MGARILDGKRIAQELLARIGRRVTERKAQGLVFYPTVRSQSLFRTGPI